MLPPKLTLAERAELRANRHARIEAAIDALDHSGYLAAVERAQQARDTLAAAEQEMRDYRRQMQQILDSVKHSGYPKFGARRDHYPDKDPRHCWRDDFHARFIVWRGLKYPIPTEGETP